MISDKEKAEKWRMARIKMSTVGVFKQALFLSRTKAALMNSTTAEWHFKKILFTSPAMAAHVWNALQVPETSKSST